jgi:hypothetical protein
MNGRFCKKKNCPEAMHHSYWYEVSGKAFSTSKKYLEIISL